MLGLFTKIHHIVPNKTTTRSRLVQTVNSVIWSCIVVPCNAVSKIQCRQKELENPSPQCALHLLLTAQTGQQEVQTHHPPTTSYECKSFAIQEVWPPNNRFFSWKAIIILKSWAVTEYEPASNLSAHSQNFCFQVALSPRYAAILNFRTRLKQFHI